MISLCMITKNEEKNLQRCLEAVKKIVDEIIVVDTGSADNTKKVAKSFGAKVINFEWCDDFSKARNESLKHATKEWILVLDPDERVDLEDLNKLKELTEKDVTGYKFTQLNYSNVKTPHKWRDCVDKDSKGYWYRGIIRLFRNHKEIKFTYPIHESVLPSIKKIKGEIENSNIDIHHYPSKGKEELYYKLLKEKIKAHPTHNSYAELAVHCFNIGKEEEGKEFAEKAIELNKDMVFLRDYY